MDPQVTCVSQRPSLFSYSFLPSGHPSPPSHSLSLPLTPSLTCLFPKDSCVSSLLSSSSPSPPTRELCVRGWAGCGEADTRVRNVGRRRLLHTWWKEHKAQMQRPDRRWRTAA